MIKKQQGNVSIAIILAGVFISLALIVISVKLDKIGEAQIAIAEKLDKAAKQKNNVGFARPLQPQGQPSGPNYNLKALNTSYQDDFVLGNKEAPFSLIVFSDFQCPFCAKFYPSAREFVETSKGKVNLVIRHYPLDFHPLADDLSIIAECLGKELSPETFWDFTDHAYKAGKIQDAELLLKSFTQAYKIENLDIQVCRSSKAVKDKVAQHLKEGKAVGVTGTPSSIIFNNKSKKAKFVMGFKSVDMLNQYLIDLK